MVLNYQLDLPPDLRSSEGRREHCPRKAAEQDQIGAGQIPQLLDGYVAHRLGRNCLDKVYTRFDQKWWIGLTVPSR